TMGLDITRYSCSDLFGRERAWPAATQGAATGRSVRAQGGRGGAQTASPSGRRDLGCAPDRPTPSRPAAADDLAPIQRRLAVAPGGQLAADGHGLAHGQVGGRLVLQRHLVLQPAEDDEVVLLVALQLHRHLEVDADDHSLVLCPLVDDALDLQRAGFVVARVVLHDVVGDVLGQRLRRDDHGVGRLLVLVLVALPLVAVLPLVVRRPLLDEGRPGLQGHDSRLVELDHAVVVAAAIDAVDAGLDLRLPDALGEHDAGRLVDRGDGVDLPALAALEADDRRAASLRGLRRLDVDPA